jgi:hypothetical protein
MVHASPGKNFMRLHHPRTLGVTCVCHPSDIRNHKIGGFQSRPTWAKSKTLPPE